MFSFISDFSEKCYSKWIEILLLSTKLENVVWYHIFDNSWLIKPQPVLYCIISDKVNAENGFKTYQQRTARPWQRPSRPVFCWTSWRGHVPLASHHHGSSRQSVSGRGLLPHHPLPHRLPLQAPQGRLHHQDLPPQHQLQRVHLSRYPEVSMVSSTYYLQSSPLHLLTALWSESRWSSCTRDCKVNWITTSNSYFRVKLEESQLLNEEL